MKDEKVESGFVPMSGGSQNEGTDTRWLLIQAYIHWLAGSQKISNNQTWYIITIFLPKGHPCLPNTNL
jgi:hypothetical protein